MGPFGIGRGSWSNGPPEDDCCVMHSFNNFYLQTLNTVMESGLVGGRGWVEPRSTGGSESAYDSVVSRLHRSQKADTECEGYQGSGVGHSNLCLQSPQDATSRDQGFFCEGQARNGGVGDRPLNPGGTWSPWFQPPTPTPCHSTLKSRRNLVHLC